MNLKIISDGTPANTKVVDAETGEPVANVTKVQWSLAWNGYAKARIDVVLMEIDAETGTVKKEAFVTDEDIQ